jgi:hypothetical protein
MTTLYKLLKKKLNKDNLYCSILFYNICYKSKTEKLSCHQFKKRIGKVVKKKIEKNFQADNLIISAETLSF